MDSTRARFSAAAPSSRSSRRYQGVLPSASDTLRKPSRPAVGVGGVGEPAEQHGQQRPLDRRLAAHPGRQCLQVAQGGGRVGVPERFEALAGRLRTQPGLAGGELGDRVEQGAVEDLLVQPPYDRSVPFPGLVEFDDGVAAQAEGAAEAAQVGLVLGHQVGAAQPVELDAVLHGPQEAVGVVQ